jgi:hypothetical protein
MANQNHESNNEATNEIQHLNIADLDVLETVLEDESYKIMGGEETKCGIRFGCNKCTQNITPVKTL